MKAKEVLKILNITSTILSKQKKIKIDVIINDQYIYNDVFIYGLIGIKQIKKNV